MILKNSDAGVMEDIVLIRSSKGKLSMLNFLQCMFSVACASTACLIMLTMSASPLHIACCI